MKFPAREKEKLHRKIQGVDKFSRRKMDPPENLKNSTKGKISISGKPGWAHKDLYPE